MVQSCNKTPPLVASKTHACADMSESLMWSPTWWWLWLGIPIYSALASPVPPIYLSGSFGLVRPAWIRYTRSAVPQNVEGLDGAL